MYVIAKTTIYRVYKHFTADIVGIAYPELADKTIILHLADHRLQT